MIQCHLSAFFTCCYVIYSDRIVPTRPVGGHFYTMRVPLKLNICENLVWVCINIIICQHKRIEKHCWTFILERYKLVFMVDAKYRPESYGLSDTGILKFLILLGLISEWFKLAPKYSAWLKIRIFTRPCSLHIPVAALVMGASLMPLNPLWKP